MGVAASPPPEAAAPADPPAKEDAQHGSAADVTAAAPPEAAAPAESPAKEEAQSAAAAADAPGGEADAAGETMVLDAAAEGGEEEEGECGFCLYMKGGGCKDEFVGWEKCVEQAEEEGGDVVERCHDATAALRRCMDKFPDYYEPILRAERAMAADLEAFKAEDEASKASPASPPAPAAEEEQGDNKKQAEAVVAKEKEDLAV